MKALCCDTGGTLVCDCACCVTTIPESWWTLVVGSWSTTELQCIPYGTCEDILYTFTWNGTTYYQCATEEPPVQFTLSKTIGKEECLKLPHAGCAYTSSAVDHNTWTNVTVTLFGDACPDLAALTPNVTITATPCDEESSSSSNSESSSSSGAVECCTATTYSTFEYRDSFPNLYNPYFDVTMCDCVTVTIALTTSDNPFSWTGKVAWFPNADGSWSALQGGLVDITNGWCFSLYITMTPDSPDQGCATTWSFTTEAGGATLQYANAGDEDCVNCVDDLYDMADFSLANQAFPCSTGAVIPFSSSSGGNITGGSITIDFDDICGMCECVDVDESSDSSSSSNSSSSSEGPNPCAPNPEMLCYISNPSYAGGWICWCEPCFTQSQINAATRISICNNYEIEHETTEISDPEIGYSLITKVAREEWSSPFHLSSGEGVWVRSVYSYYAETYDGTTYYSISSEAEIQLSYNGILYRDYVYAYASDSGSEPPLPTPTVGMYELGIIATGPSTYVPGIMPTYDDYRLTDAFFGSFVIGDFTFGWERGAGW